MMAPSPASNAPTYPTSQPGCRPGPNGRWKIPFWLHQDASRALRHGQTKPQVAYALSLWESTGNVDLTKAAMECGIKWLLRIDCNAHRERTQFFCHQRGCTHCGPYIEVARIREWTEDVTESYHLVTHANFLNGGPHLKLGCFELDMRSGNTFLTRSEAQRFHRIIAYISKEIQRKGGRTLSLGAGYEDTVSEGGRDQFRIRMWCYMPQDLRNLVEILFRRYCAADASIHIRASGLSPAEAIRKIFEDQASPADLEPREPDDRRPLAHITEIQARARARDEAIFHGIRRVFSFGAVIAKVRKEKHKPVTIPDGRSHNRNDHICPECGEPMVVRGSALTKEFEQDPELDKKWPTTDQHIRNKKAEDPAFIAYDYPRFAREQEERWSGCGDDEYAAVTTATAAA